MASSKSSAELYFEWWLNELKDKGIVVSWEREPITFEVMPPLPVFYNNHKKTKTVVQTFNLFQSITYTPDYRVIFNRTLYGKLFGLLEKNKPMVMPQLYDAVEQRETAGNIYQDTLFYAVEGMDNNSKFNNEFILYFDVKPPASAVRFSGALGSVRDFPIKQRILYENKGIYINKVVPVGSKTSLFCKTFLPKRYQYTDVSMSPRKLKDYEKKCLTINQYLLK